MSRRSTRHCGREHIVGLPRATATPKRPGIILQLSVQQGEQDLLDLAERIAGSERPVLLTGEIGTGKDLLARYIHYHSGRYGEFVPVNTAAIPSEMVEAELFGHTKGAYTGAMSDRAAESKGIVESAGDFNLTEFSGLAKLDHQRRGDSLKGRAISVDIDSLPGKLMPIRVLDGAAFDFGLV